MHQVFHCIVLKQDGSGKIQPLCGTTDGIDLLSIDTQILSVCGKSQLKILSVYTKCMILMSVMEKTEQVHIPESQTMTSVNLINILYIYFFLF